MEPVSIRKAERADAHQLADIGFRAWENGILPMLTERPGMRRAESHRLAEAVAETLNRIIVAETDGFCAGWCSRAAHRAYIPYLFVAPEFQSIGIGSMLLRRMESMMELTGAERVQLETPADNIRAVKFYEKQGYRILAMRPEGRAAHEPFLSVRLEKQLNPFRGTVRDE